MGAEPLHDAGDDAVLDDLRAQARATLPLSSGETDRLLEKSARGDHGSLDRLVAGHLGMVIRLAEERENQGLSVPDLVQEGSLGLVEAVQTFGGGDTGDTGEFGEFAAFARRKVGDQMDAAIAAEAAAVRAAQLLVAAANDYERTELLLRRELKRTPTDAEVAEKLEWTVDRTRYVAEVVADARRRHDEELLAFIDPDAIGIEAVDGRVSGDDSGDDSVDE